MKRPFANWSGSQQVAISPDIFHHSPTTVSIRLQWKTIGVCAKSHNQLNRMELEFFGAVTLDAFLMCIFFWFYCHFLENCQNSLDISSEMADYLVRVYSRSQANSFFSTFLANERGAAEYKVGCMHILHMCECLN